MKKMLSIICHQVIAIKIMRHHYTSVRMARKYRILATPKIAKMWSSNNSHSFLEEMQNGSVSLEDCFVVPNKTKHCLTMQTNSHIPCYLSK
jgi:hypothetical protein